MADSEGYTCEGCHQVFLIKKEKEDHFEEVHLKIFACEESDNCIAEFRSDLLRAIHIMDKHRTIEKHKCENCEDKFWFKTVLNEHLAQKHGKILSPECEECGKLFNYVDDLKKHLNKVHSKLQAYICPEHCGLFFPIKDDLMRHLVEVEKVTCQECRQFCDCKTKLYTHMKAVHGQE
ncbi:zinc finger protein 43-like [Trichogramma pretiosum]|uniref:zinc finger protein 43-like n=1 Tax=Trichogramma pretiosum TaxID=7493 RepID=UPI000C71C5F8|nr:zinc finger protein 43-like [Trichogramma pretiosum]